MINNQIFNLDSTGVYKITAGPSTRRIVDFSDVENSLGILPTGQSGNVFSAEINMIVSCGIRTEKGVYGERFRIPFEEVYKEI